MRNYQTPPRQNQANPGTAPNGSKNRRFPTGVPPRNEARPATKTGVGRSAPPSPPPRTRFANERAEASFGRRKNGSHPRTDVRDEPPATNSNYRSRPPPVPQGPTSTATTDPPVTESPQAMDKDNTPPTTSTPPHQPPEFPFPQPAQTTSSHHPFEPPEQPQQPAESKQSSGTIPMPSAGQDTNDEPAWTEWQSDNTPNANEKRPGNPKTPFDLDREGSGGGREFRFPIPPTAPQIPALIHGVQPSEIDKDTYLEDFKTYLKEWNLFKNQIIGHFLARKGTITNLQNSGSGDIQQYSDWLVQDADIRGLFIAAVEEHEIQFRQFRQFMTLFQM
ncbi:hypothetical protein FOMA001_g17690 [Fusarium oxysporum f. sp. matthiolae]|nr:hypothetical protein FOMA001_g17690 [Fusarium oxysporum f. sp. matthiolae]